MKETCDRHNQTLPDEWKCYGVNLTFSLPFGGTMDGLVVQQAALGYVETILQQYNLEHLDEAFVEYRNPKFVDAAMTVYAVGLKQTVMNNAQKELFLKVFRQGFDAVLASKASPVPMAVYEAKILYQVPPLAAEDSASDESIRARLNSNSSTSTTSTPVESSDSDAVPLTSNLAVRMLVRATCSGPGCHDGALATALWEKGQQHAAAWATGIRDQAEKASNAALRSYFGPLVTIVLESPTASSVGSGNHHNNVSGVYHPLSEVDDTQGVPTWIWIVIGVDAGILLVALLVACCRVSKRRKEWTNDNNKKPTRSDRDSTSPESPPWSRPYQEEEPIPEQYPHEPYPNMAGLKEAAGSSHRDASGNDGDDEFHDEGSDRVFDDGIRVREAQVEPEDEHDEFHDDGSDRIFDDGIRVREAQVDPDDWQEEAGHGAPSAPPPQRPPPPPPPSSPTPPHEDLPYDDGVRVSIEDAGQKSRVHDDGIHISNSIQDID